MEGIISGETFKSRGTKIAKTTGFRISELIIYNDFSLGSILIYGLGLRNLKYRFILVEAHPWENNSAKLLTILHTGVTELETEPSSYASFIFPSSHSLKSKAVCVREARKPNEEHMMKKKRFFHLPMLRK